jgi:hypothetical protein
MNKLWVLSASALTMALAACSGGSTSESSTVTVAGDVPIAYAMRVNTISMNPTNGGPSAPGGDLMIREKSSASAVEHNITTQFTQGKGDATGPEVSYDGKKIVFAMKLPDLEHLDDRRQAGLHRPLEHLGIRHDHRGSHRRHASGASPARPTRTTSTRPTCRRARAMCSRRTARTSPTSTRRWARPTSRSTNTSASACSTCTRSTPRASNLAQISFNQSHDRSPTVRLNGDIMFSHWDHVGGRNHFKVFRAKPDGTDLFVLYGAHSDGNSFLHPRDMDPKGKYAGFLASDLMPLSRTHEGGALVFIDAANYSEQNTPANAGVPATGGQSYPTAQILNFGGGVSQYGRVTTPYPLWDGTDRVLVSYTPVRGDPNGVVVPCATLTDADERRAWATTTASSPTSRPTPCRTTCRRPTPSTCSTRQADLADRRRAADGLHVHQAGRAAAAHRAERTRPDQRRRDARGAEHGPARSAQRLRHRRPRPHGRRGADRRRPARRLHDAIAKTTPSDPLDTRKQVADIVRIKDPADAAYGCAPARFVRAVRAVAPPQGMTGMRSAIGETEFEMQQILGYAPIEPDGSFKLQVPADTPIALAVVDAEGRAFQTHTNWIQVRPGERRTCDGCHSPRRGGALNSGAVVNAQSSGAAAGDGERAPVGRDDGLDPHASTRRRCNSSADPVYADIWADVSKTGVTARSSIALRYTGNADRGRRPGDRGADQRHHQLPGSHRAAVDAAARRRRCEHLHQLPQRSRQARPARPSPAAAAWCRTTS